MYQCMEMRYAMHWEQRIKEQRKGKMIIWWERKESDEWRDVGEVK